MNKGKVSSSRHFCHFSVFKGIFLLNNYNVIQKVINSSYSKKDTHKCDHMAAGEVGERILLLVCFLLLYSLLY